MMNKPTAETPPTVVDEPFEPTVTETLPSELPLYEDRDAAANPIVRGSGSHLGGGRGIEPTPDERGLKL
jgi:hypothetical protein